MNFNDRRNIAFFFGLVFMVISFMPQLVPDNYKLYILAFGFLMVAMTTLLGGGGKYKINIFRFVEVEVQEDEKLVDDKLFL